jgi:MraZ protein
LFLGTFERKLDSSYRFRLPKELLRELSPGCHKSLPCLSIFGECLVVYPPKRFRQLVESFSAFELSNPEHRQLARDLFANIENCKVDSTGRMTLPEHSRNSAGISFDVVLVGAGKYFEIWSKEFWPLHKR